MKADICGRCDIPLTDKNWYPSARKRRWLICKHCERDRQNEYNRNNPDKVFKRNCFRKYGITYDQYLELLDSQGGVCAICSGKERHPTKKNLSVDHCHSTGEVRGLLCGHCNTALGLFKDNVKLIEKAKEYLDAM